ncbi:MAG: VOC family protein [Rhizobiaceae bacterium]|nr:VOC family protein [Rhizobiaceae bacterium]
MAVLRIVPNFACADPHAARRFYEDVLGLQLVMDHGWIATFAAEAAARPQISLASEGGSGTPVPDISVEVDDLEAVYDRATSDGYAIVYPLTREPWGVGRFFVREPAGCIVNVLCHEQA